LTSNVSYAGSYTPLSPDFWLKVLEALNHF
jgi:hypothetical protein